MSFSMLECLVPPGEEAILLGPPPEPSPGLLWCSGRRFPRRLPEPVILTMDAGPPARLLELYHEEAIVMTRRLSAALVEAGVDNLDMYDAVLRHPATGFESTDYVAAILVGLVAAADIGQSRVVGGSPDHLIDVDFDSVVIDEARAHDLLMFRLAECTSAVVVHDRVKKHLLRRGFDMLTFMPPEEWMG